MKNEIFATRNHNLLTIKFLFLLSIFEDMQNQQILITEHLHIYIRAFTFHWYMPQYLMNL